MLKYLQCFLVERTENINKKVKFKYRYWELSSSEGMWGTIASQYSSWTVFNQITWSPGSTQESLHPPALMPGRLHSTASPGGLCTLKFQKKCSTHPKLRKTKPKSLFFVTMFCYETPSTLEFLFTYIMNKVSFQGNTQRYSLSSFSPVMYH